MAVSRQKILGWLRQGKKLGCTHLIVVCDTYDWEDYPVYINARQDAKAIAAEYDGKKMQKLMGVYNLSLDFEKQLNEHRAFNY